MECEFDLNRILFGEAETTRLGVLSRDRAAHAGDVSLHDLPGPDGRAGRHRTIGPFEFVLVIAVGSAAGDPMFYPEVGLLQGILVITVVILLHRATGFMIQQNTTLENKIEGGPMLVIEDGTIAQEARSGLS